ncbi:MAG: DegT/DnrJ/EryC1/StrS family aminotransferase [Deltaproteobacteria bacterium]|nr:DegT/DnrJ/EryC1/StrS family aminotransferase [Deltaproteobacteria bacterium]
MNVPILNLKRQYESIKDELTEAMNSVLEAQNFILGAQVKELETDIAKYTGAKYAIGVGSGTDALLLAMKAAGIGPGDEVITTPFTFVATADTILLTGATPVFVDVDPKTFNMDARLVREAVTEKTRAIVPVHLYGQSVDMDEIMNIARENNLAVIEDVAQAIGGKWNGQGLGSIGTAGCLSFFPSKNLGCFGDGGMIVTNDDKLAEVAGMLRKHGGKDKYNVDILGHNSRLDTLQAAVLIVKLKYLDEWNRGRQQLARAYNDAFDGVEGITTPIKDGRAEHIYHQYTIRTTKRDELQAHLKAEGVGSMVYYPVALHKQKLFNDTARIHGNLTEAERATEEVLSLPIDPLQSEDETAYVIEKVKGF